MSLTMWWPSPEALEDLTVEDSEHGFELSAPDETECGAWLNFWSQDEKHQKTFNDAFVEVLKDYLNFLETENGETEAIDDQQSDHRTQTKNDLDRVQS